jgi:lipopolysaccharide/colanic/teichoic acid biosynthesis glycosyltransferase
MTNSKPIKENILPKSHFLERLRLEKRRVDRSKAPLSMVLFCFDSGKMRGDGRSIVTLLSSFKNDVRETDIKGWVDDNSIGLLLPDTDEKGVRRCADKISNGNGDQPYSVITATYPDHIFQKLLSEDRLQPTLFPLDIDDTARPRRLQSVLKRAIDIMGSLIGLILSSPIIFLTAIALKATSPGPVIFKQTRLGMKGNRFSFYKFRSMYCDCDDQIHRQYVSDLIKGNLEKINQGKGNRPLFKMKTDPRITKVGRIIRKTSVDELPQFFNVLKGDMSLVGPRPPLLYEVEKYEPWHLRRILEAKPGITGLWQVDGRSQTSFNDMVRMDLRYVQNWSLDLDMKILVKTVKAVLRPNGAV